MDVSTFATAVSLGSVASVLERLALLAYFQRKANHVTTFSLNDVRSWFLAACLPRPNLTRLKASLRRSRDFHVVAPAAYSLTVAALDRLDGELTFVNIGHPDNALRSGSGNYVAEARIEALRKIEHPDFDFSRVVQICEELNFAYRYGGVISIAALIRALVDHIPPVFRFRTFPEVANNYGGGRSMKDLLTRLQETSRKISDRQLHSQISRWVDIPTLRQVDFANELDAFLGELIHLASPNNKTREA